MLNLNRLKYGFLTLVLLLISAHFVNTTLEIRDSSKRLDELQAEVERLELDKAQITEDLNYQKSPEYVEKMARNKLNMVKPGEHVYVVSEDYEWELNKNNVLSASTGQKSFISEERSNLYLWFKLLF